MSVKRKLIECECGEFFEEAIETSIVTGNLKYGAWKFKNYRLKATKSETGADVLALLWVRNVDCSRCGASLFVEKRQYELTPPDDVTKPEVINSYGQKDLVLKKVETLAKPE